MSTWAELRQDVLFALGESRSASSTNDIRLQVDRKLQKIRDELYGLRPPRSLLVYTGPVTIPSTLDYISITSSGSGDTPGFAASDFWREYSISVGESDTTSIGDAEEWEPVEWETWIRSNSSVEGNQRLGYTFTIDYQNRIYLRSLPDGSDTWTAWLNYFKTPATFSDGATPEIGLQFERILTLGATLEFPDLFRGEERGAIYAATYRMYGDLKKDYLRANTPKRSGSRFRPFRKRLTARALNWGGLQPS